MKMMPKAVLRGALVMGMALGGLTSCEDKEAQAEIEQLKGELHSFS